MTTGPSRSSCFGQERALERKAVVPPGICLLRDVYQCDLAPMTDGANYDLIVFVAMQADWVGIES